MSSYIIDVKNTSDEEGTIIADIGFSYTDNLNDINKGQLKISGTGVTRRSLFEIGSEVKIYRNNTLSFHGIINGISYLDGGGISADLLGYESWLAKENGAYSGSPWSSTASATIASAIIGESNYFTAGTIDAGASIDFRSEATDSLYNALQRLIKRVGQDIGIDYPNAEVDILDHKGSSSSVMTLNDGIQMRDMIVRHSYPIGNDVRVYGKSEGQTRIKSDESSYGQDASSKSTYGTIRKDFPDNSVTTQAEANAMANVLVAKWKDPVKIYEFDVMNPNQSLVCGDVITLNSSTKGLSAEEVRIVSIKRGVDASKEFMTLEVTNKEYSRMSTTINQKIAELENQAKNIQTYDSYFEEYANQNVDTTVGGFMTTDLIGATLNSIRQIANSGALTLGTTSGNKIYLIPSNGDLNADVQVWGNLDMYTNKIINLATPTANYDAATKKYVDDNISGAGTSYWSCPGSHFSSAFPDADNVNFLNSVATADEDGKIFSAPVFLPDGATITAAICYGNASATAETWSLQRMELDNLGGEKIAEANFDTQDTSILGGYEVVDNSLYKYFLKSASMDTGDSIYGARITYTI